jgi:hypothetical protein
VEAALSLPSYIVSLTNKIRCMDIIYQVCGIVSLGNEMAVFRKLQNQKEGAVTATVPPVGGELVDVVRVGVDVSLHNSQAVYSIYMYP